MGGRARSRGAHGNRAPAVGRPGETRAAEAECAVARGAPARPHNPLKIVGAAMNAMHPAGSTVLLKL